MISGDTITNTAPEVTAFEKLQNASAPSAFHDSSTRFDPPKCHPNTRVAVLEYLMGWIFGRNDPEALILWLYGPAGAGKSAILQTLAEQCFKRKILVASFFFGRSDPTRNTSNPLVATIAYQIARDIPQIKCVIEDAIERNPLIFGQSIATQLQSLIVDPLMGLAAAGFFRNPRNWRNLLILIDSGLDECNGSSMQSTILRALANALCDQELPIIFLIASRAEPHLTLTFNSEPLVGLWRSLVLDDSFKPDDDIRLFFTDSFQKIKSTHPFRHLIPAVWPDPSDVDKAVQKSSGQFIYASVVVKYISDPLDRPPRRLRIVIDLCPVPRAGPFAELDALYLHILGSCADPDTVLLILGASICGVQWKVDVSIGDVEMIMDLEPGDAEVALAPLTSLMRLDVLNYGGVVEKKFIHSYHASFRDFLVDISRSDRFHVNTATVMEHIFFSCLRKCMDPLDVRQFGDRMAVNFRNYYEILADSLTSIVEDIPFTETVQNALYKFSLPQVWSRWSSGSLPSRSMIREVAIRRFLTSLRLNTESAEREQIYKFHLSSFESTVKSEIQSYLHDVGHTALLVISVSAFKVSYLNIPRVTNHPRMVHAHEILFRLPNESSSHIPNPLHLPEHEMTNVLHEYRYLFTGSTAEFPLDGQKHAQTALRILEYLYAHPLHLTPHFKAPRKHKILQRDSTRPRAFPPLLHYIPWRVPRTKWLSDIGLPRKWRETKHLRWVPLSFSFSDQSTLDYERYNVNVVEHACMLGLSYLPAILRRSSKSPELVDFIRTHGKDIVIVPKLTRKAIRAMYKYLDRSEEDGVMIDTDSSDDDSSDD